MNLSHPEVGRGSISCATYDSFQPQSCGNHHRAPFHSNLVSLHMHQVQCSLFYNGVMHPLIVVSRSILPVRNSAFIQSIGQQYHHRDNQFHWCAKPLHHRSPPRTKGMTTTATEIPLALAIMKPNVPLPCLASCRTRHIGAKLEECIHRLFCVCFHTHIMPMFVAFFKPSFLFHQLVGLYLSPHKKIRSVEYMLQEGYESTYLYCRQPFLGLYNTILWILIVL